MKCDNTKAAFIREHLHTGSREHMADMKSVDAHRNVLNRGLRELAEECGGASEALRPHKEVFDAGVRGRFRLTKAERETPQAQLTCSRGSFQT